MMARGAKYGSRSKAVVGTRGGRGVANAPSVRNRQTLRERTWDGFGAWWDARGWLGSGLGGSAFLTAIRAGRG